jgi:hypothetical protein
VKAAEGRFGPLTRQAPEAVAIAAAGLLSQLAGAALGFVLVSQLDASALGKWGLATSVTQFLPLFALGGPLWLYVYGARNQYDVDPNGQDEQVLFVTLATCPSVILVFTIVAIISGLNIGASIAFGAACAAFQLTSYQIVRLKNAGRLVVANGALGLDRLAMMLIFAGMSAVWTVSTNSIAYSWLFGQAVAVGTTIALAPLPRPRRPASYFAYRDGFYVAITLASINSALSLARLPIVPLGADAVGTFVATGYLALPVLAAGSAIDQLAFLRLASRSPNRAVATVGWASYARMTILGGGVAALVMRVTGPWLLTSLNPQYSEVATLAGPIVAWALSMNMLGLAMKRLYGDKRLIASARLSVAVCAVMLLGLSVPVFLGADLRTSVQGFAACGFVASLFVSAKAHSDRSFDKLVLYVWGAGVLLLAAS